MTVTYEVIQDTVLSGTTSIGVGASAEVTIRDADTAALITLFQDRLGAGGESNPFNADANGQFRVYAAPGRLQISITFESVTRIWEDFRLGDPDEINKGAISNFGFTTTLDSPSAGDILLAFFQGDNAANCSAIAPASFNFAGTKEALKLIAAKTLKLDAIDDFGLDDRAANSEIFLFLYAIDRDGSLEFGIGPRPDFTRATADFTAVEGEAINRDHVFCSAAITVNDPCYVIGYFQATYDTTAQDWSAITANSEEVGTPPGPHPDGIVKGWVSFNGSGTIAILDSFNVLSITDNGGAGNYTVTWDTDFSSADYAATAAATITGGGTKLINNLAGSIDVLIYNSSDALTDTPLIHMIACGDQ